MNRSILQSQIKEDLNQVGVDICLGILDDLLYGDWDLDHISFADLCFWAEDQKELLKILPYITGDRTHLLDLKAYFEDGETKHYLTEDQFRTANDGEIRHPITNELLDYVEGSKKVFIYFVASDVVRGIRV